MRIYFILYYPFVCWFINHFSTYLKIQTKYFVLVCACYNVFCSFSFLFACASILFLALHNAMQTNVKVNQDPLSAPKQTNPKTPPEAPPKKIPPTGLWPLFICTSLIRLLKFSATTNYRSYDSKKNNPCAINDCPSSIATE